MPPLQGGHRARGQCVKAFLESMAHSNSYESFVVVLCLSIVVCKDYCNDEISRERTRSMPLNPFLAADGLSAGTSLATISLHTTTTPRLQHTPFPLASTNCQKTVLEQRRDEYLLFILSSAQSLYSLVYTLQLAGVARNLCLRKSVIKRHLQGPLITYTAGYQSDLC